MRWHKQCAASTGGPAGVACDHVCTCVLSHSINAICPANLRSEISIMFDLSPVLLVAGF
jgi:hypothetical protein